MIGHGFWVVTGSIYRVEGIPMYPLVIVYIVMGKHHFIAEEINYK